VLLMYCRHPDQGVREMAAQAVLKQGRYHLIVELLKDKDPRARHAGTMAIAVNPGSKKGSQVPADRFTDEMAQLLIGMMNDPAESWWVARGALVALNLARPELLVPHLDRLSYWVQQEEWWLQSAAVGAIAGIATDERCYKQAVPVIGRMVAANRVMSLATQWGALGKLTAKLKEAKPEVQALAVQVLGDAYTQTPATLTAPGGLNMNPAVEVLVQEQASILAGVPGGFDELYLRARARYAGRALPHQDIFLSGRLSGPV
jgi:hypothetical protein